MNEWMEGRMKASLSLIITWIKLREREREREREIEREEGFLPTIWDDQKRVSAFRDQKDSLGNQSVYEF